MLNINDESHEHEKTYECDFKKVSIQKLNDHDDSSLTKKLSKNEELTESLICNESQNEQGSSAFEDFHDGRSKPSWLDTENMRWDHWTNNIEGILNLGDLKELVPEFHKDKAYV